jgi:hypothetical protein
MHERSCSGAVQCSPDGPSGCEPRSGALDRLERRSYAAATTWDVAVSYGLVVVLAIAGRAAAAGPEGVSP